MRALAALLLLASSSTASAQSYTLNLFNVDDVLTARLNGTVFTATYGQSKSFDVSSIVNPSSNTLSLELVNSIGGYTYGYSVVGGGQTLVSGSCGTVGVFGCDNNSSRLGSVYTNTVTFSGVSAPPPPPPPPPLIERSTVEQIVNYAIVAIDGTRDIFVEYVSSNDVKTFLESISERITTSWSSAVTRIGGVITNLGTGLLDPDAQQGVSALHDAAKDPNSDTNGLIGSPQRRQQLQNILQEIDAQGQPVQPTSSQNGVSRFDVPVQKGVPIVIDPFIASGFEYAVGVGDPLFASFALPAFGTFQTQYNLAVYDGVNWLDSGAVDALSEYTFATPVSAFRISGINPGLNLLSDNHSSWITMLSFAGDGRFTGTMTALPAPIPEPSTWAMMLLGFGAIGASMRRRQRASARLLTAA